MSVEEGSISFPTGKHYISYKSQNFWIDFFALGIFVDVVQYSLCFLTLLLPFRIITYLSSNFVFILLITIDSLKMIIPEEFIAISLI